MPSILTITVSLVASMIKSCENSSKNMDWKAILALGLTVKSSKSSIKN